jgi:hypothetical protein
LHCSEQKSDPKNGTIPSFHFIDMAVVSSWLLYGGDCILCGTRRKDQLSLLQFKAEVAACLCQEIKTGVKMSGRPSSSSLGNETELKEKRPNSAPLPVQDVRRNKIGNWPVVAEQRARCKKPNCGGVAKIMCMKCKVHCTSLYH